MTEVGDAARPPVRARLWSLWPACSRALSPPTSMPSYLSGLAALSQALLEQLETTRALAGKVRETIPFRPRW